MCKETPDNDKKKGKNIFGRMMDKLDKKMEEKAKTSCCGKKDNSQGPSCCK
ncbi:MAG: hypothetical protein ABIJ41_01695 [Candidatus Omnitrophota bacterium]